MRGQVGGFISSGRDWLLNLSISSFVQVTTSNQTDAGNLFLKLNSESWGFILVAENEGTPKLMYGKHKGGLCGYLNMYINI